MNCECQNLMLDWVISGKASSDLFCRKINNQENIIRDSLFNVKDSFQGYGQWRWMWFKHSACDRIGKFSSGVQREPYFLVKALQDYSRHRLAHGIVCSVDTQTQSVLSSINRHWCCCNINLWLQFTANHINFSPLRSSWYYLKVIETEINFKN